jgi:hypothetical protein
MASSSGFKLEPPSSQRYPELIEKWWNWIYLDNPDENQTQTGVTFVRDNIIGSRLDFPAGVEILDFSGGIDSSGPPGETFKNNISIDEGSAVFLPVYHVNFVKEHPNPLDNGSPCGDTGRCKKAATNDLSNVYQKWAKYTKNGGDMKDITRNFDTHTFEIEFPLEVKSRNNLDREKGFELAPRPEKYQGITRGMYLLLTDFEPATYRINFGGRATNYRTQSIYGITVK